ncbi:MAG TPA: hypothetical protein PKC54_13605 [Ferruginibacter sp.]|nr:hypothetical protein [Ferruginibacter sp.]
MADIGINQLVNFIKKIPAIDTEVSSGVYENNNWWVKISIDISHQLAWNVVQELGHVINYISLNERLPAAFYPVSSPPYLNGGPKDFLYWIIESKETDFTALNLKDWLESRLPNPVNDINEWDFEK